MSHRASAQVAPYYIQTGTSPNIRPGGCPWTVRPEAAGPCRAAQRVPPPFGAEGRCSCARPLAESAGTPSTQIAAYGIVAATLVTLTQRSQQYGRRLRANILCSAKADRARSVGLRNVARSTGTGKSLAAGPGARSSTARPPAAASAASPTDSAAAAGNTANESRSSIVLRHG